MKPGSKISIASGCDSITKNKLICMKKQIMKLCVLSVLLTCALVNGMAQTYVYTKVEGEAYEFTADLSTLPGWIEGVGPGRFTQTILSHPNNNVLSEWQDLPFTWSFFGQPVNGYYASDNGYISFDRGATASIPANTRIPNPSEPNDAIYAFWDYWYLSSDHSPRSNQVRNLTFGKAPNRQHMIQWIMVTPYGQPGGSSNNASFYIVLHEEGGFDIVHQAGRKQVPMAGTIGVENHDGSVATMVDGSPDIDFPALSPAPDDIVYYTFRYTEMLYAASVRTSNLPNMLVISEPFQLKGEIVNNGLETIHSYDICYQVDEGDVIVQTIQNVSVASSASHAFAHNVLWQPKEAGKMYHVKIWVENINGGAKGTEPPPEKLSGQVFSHLGNTAPKQVLVEQFTGTWCVWCPDGSLQMDKIKRKHGNAVLVAIHAGGNDRMIVPEGQEITTLYSPGFPMAMVDRFLFEDQRGVPLSRNQDRWLRAYELRSVQHTPVKLNIAHQYDPAERKVEATVEAIFTDYAYPGDIRLHIYVVEDKVTGQGSGYDQANAFAGNYSFPDHPYFNAPNPISGYVHRHVLRAVPSGSEGTSGIIPQKPVPGDVFSADYAFDIPDGIHTSEIKLVAFVAYHDPDDITKRTVLNATQLPLIK